MRHVASSLSLGALLLLAACASMPPVSPYGRQATVFLNGAPRVTGELIATSADSVWVGSNGSFASFSRADIRKVDVQRHEFGFGWSVKSTATIGAATGAALVVACASYNASDGGGDAGGCLLLIPVFTLIGGALGVVWGVFNHFSTTLHFRPSEFGDLNRFARFPQGMPPAIGASALPPRER